MTNLTNSRAHNPLTVAEVTLIIDTCAKANVRRFQALGLHLELGESGPASSPRPPLVTEPNLPTEAALSEKHHQKQNEETLRDEELQTKEERLAQMFIEDPLQAEKMMEEGDLDDGDDFDEEDAHE